MDLFTIPAYQGSSFFCWNRVAIPLVLFVIFWITGCLSHFFLPLCYHSFYVFDLVPLYMFYKYVCPEVLSTKLHWSTYVRPFRKFVFCPQHIVCSHVSNKDMSYDSYASSCYSIPCDVFYFIWCYTDSTSFFKNIYLKHIMHMNDIFVIFSDQLLKYSTRHKETDFIWNDQLNLNSSLKTEILIIKSFSVYFQTYPLR